MKDLKGKGNMGKTTRKKVQKEGQNGKKEYRKEKKLKGNGSLGRQGRRFRRKDKEKKEYT